MTMDDNGKIPFPPVEEPARLYPGKVMHARLMPFGHRFTYRVFSLLIDLDRLGEANALSRLFSVNRRNLVSFHEADHIDGKSDASGLRAYAESLVEGAGLPRPARIQLLAYPRILGYVFNPLSVYYCYGRNGDLAALIYEVRNTFGERHTYVCPVEPGQTSEAGIRQERTKIFYVSPFIDLGARYHFRMLPPGDTVRLRILETEGGQPLLSATFAGDARPLKTTVLASLLARLPLMTLKVVAGIHWEALKLWLKGAKFHSRRKPPATVSYRDPQNALEPAE
jgi:DUF1365 family protein